NRRWRPPQRSAWPGLRLGLGLHLLGDTEPLVYVSKLSAGGARRYRGDGLRLEQGLLERLCRADEGHNKNRSKQDITVINHLATIPSFLRRAAPRPLCAYWHNPSFLWSLREKRTLYDPLLWKHQHVRRGQRR